MSKPVLFAGTRPYGRAENISALYDAYQGEKQYLGIYDYGEFMKINDKDYDIMVIDEFPRRFAKKNILIWHAIQGGKYIGYNQPKPYIEKALTDKIDYVIAAGNNSIDMWVDCAHLPAERILPLGMPRTDTFIGKTKGDGHTILATKRAYLYVPTFREPDEPSNFQVNFDWLDEHLTNDELLVVKVHMREQKILKKQYKHIVEISSSEPSNPFLYDCDVIITDYSSILFDGYLLNKPAVLFEKQIGYANYRGMYLKYPQEYSSKYATNEKELLDLLHSTNTLTQVELDVIDKVANKCDGHSCERICNLIEELKRALAQSVSART